jgi:hypothetical protein
MRNEFGGRGAKRERQGTTQEDDSAHIGHALPMATCEFHLSVFNVFRQNTVDGSDRNS